MSALSLVAGRHLRLPPQYMPNDEEADDHKLLTTTDHLLA
jgi:hypothetical protein